MESSIRVYLVRAKRSPYLWAQWVDPATGRRLTKSLKTACPREAKRLKGFLEYELNHGLYHPPERGNALGYLKTWWARATEAQRRAFAIGAEGEEIAELRGASGEDGGQRG